MGAVDADTDTAARGEMRLCSRAPAVSAHRADGRASRVRIRPAGSCALSWRAYRLELRSSRLVKHQK